MRIIGNDRKRNAFSFLRFSLRELVDRMQVSDMQPKAQEGNPCPSPGFEATSDTRTDQIQ